MATTGFFWTGRLSTEWADANGKLTNWALSPGGTTTLTTPGGANDSAYFEIDAEVTGTGGAENIFVEVGATVTFAGHFGAGFDEAPDTGLDISNGTVIIASGGGLSDVGFDLIAGGSVLEVQSGAGYGTTNLTVGTESGGELTADGGFVSIAQSSPGATDGLLVVGDAGGDGSVTLTNNSQLFAATTIVAQGDGSIGDITLDDSTWGGSSLMIGPDGNGTVTITNGAVAAITTVTIGPNGELDVTAAAGLTSTLIAPILTIAFGTLTISGGGEVNVGGAAGVQGALDVAGATVTGLGTINGNVVLGPSGVIDADQPVGGTLTVNGNISGVGTLEPVRTLEVNGGIAAGVTIQFSAPPAGSTGDGVLQLDVPRADDATITGFAVGDTIDIEGLLYSNAVFTAGTGGNPGMLTLSGGSDAPLQLKVDGSYSPDSFIATPGTTDTLVTLTPCYCRGTLIRTVGGDTPVEALRIGDSVMTIGGIARPIKWIGRRSYGGRFVLGRRDILPICIKAGAVARGVPARDLWISPHHAMYLEGVLIEARDLVNGASVVQSEDVEEVEYFHIELATHDIIIAEGAWSETYLDDDNRYMFHNAADYFTRYPGTAVPAGYCAPRLSEGRDVEAARRRIARRAGLAAAPTRPIGALRGYVEAIEANRIAGWAQAVEHPEVPVCLDIYVGNRLVGQALANRYREDLRKAGLGSGCHGFEWMRPAESSPTSDAIEVRRSLDGARLEFLGHDCTRARA